MKTIIIAEAGVNHNGDMNMAKTLIEKAAMAGADYVKFQSFKASELTTKLAQKADYQKENTNPTDSQFDMIKTLELSYENHKTLIDECKKHHIRFLSTAFDEQSLNMLMELNCLDFIKIPSGEATNLPFLRVIASKNKPIILSTGMCDEDEVANALAVLTQAGVKKEMTTILHCTTDYPTEMQDVNLKAMQTMGKKFGTKIGYSDHTIGIEVPIAAAAMGASVIEKHFTLDRGLAGPDHKVSLIPDELSQMVKAIRNIELALGDGVKKPTKGELKNRPIARKIIVAKCDINKGDKLNDKNLTTKRAGIGLSPMLWDKVMGKQAKRDFQADEPIDI